MTIALCHYTHPLTEADRNQQIYAGHILIFSGFAAVQALVDQLADKCRHYFSVMPEQLHTLGSERAVDRLVTGLRQDLRNDPSVAAGFNHALRAVGVDIDSNYGDGVVLRAQAAGSNGDLVRTGPLPAHRDTWGTNLMAQTNWWAPLFPTTTGRTIAFFPAYFAQPVANDSATWDFTELRRQLRDNYAAPNYPMLPTIDHALPWHEALVINLEPGDLLCFSSAHLHLSVPNHTGKTRLSMESRTVNGRDAVPGRGAPNVDGHAPYLARQLFTHLTTGQKLGQLTRR